MNRMCERNTASPAESNDSVLLLCSGERHPVFGHSVELFLNPGRVEGSDRGLGQRGKDTVRSLRKILHRQEIGRDSDESIRRQLVGNTTYPGGESEDLVHHYYDWCLGASLGINHEGAQAVAIACANDDPLPVSRGSTQSGESTRGIGREALVVRLGRYCSGRRRCSVISM
jgi:hypothetical protein